MCFDKENVTVQHQVQLSTFIILWYCVNSTYHRPEFYFDRSEVLKHLVTFRHYYILIFQLTFENLILVHSRNRILFLLNINILHKIEQFFNILYFVFFFQATFTQHSPSATNKRRKFYYVRIFFFPKTRKFDFVLFDIS